MKIHIIIMCIISDAQVFHGQSSYSVTEEDGVIDVCAVLEARMERRVEVNLFTGDGTATGLQVEIWPDLLQLYMSPF